MRSAWLAIAVITLAPPQAHGQAVPAPSTAAAGSTPAAAPSVTAGAQWIASSAYVWRGFVPVEGTSLQSEAWVRIGALTLSSWLNVAPSAERRLDEHDLTVDFSRTVGRFTWSAGWVNYLFPGVADGKHTNEIYVGVTHESSWAPTLTMYGDPHRGTGLYASAGVERTFTWQGGRWSLSPSVVLGYNHRQWIDASGLSDLQVGLEAEWAIRSHVSAAPFVGYSWSLMPSAFSNRGYGGIAIVMR